MLKHLYLIRHGEVHNPDGIVYADLPGYGLSDLGRTQATDAGRRLTEAPPTAVWTSPLERAVQTSQAIVAETGAELHVDPRATEWGLGTRWAGVEWAQLPTTFPGELEAYLEHPTQLDFTPETIEAVALRMAELVGDIGASLPEGSVALVSHQDPVQALRLHLTGRSLADLQEDKPGHACVITLVSTENRWSEIDSWCPRQSETPFPPVGDREPS